MKGTGARKRWIAVAGAFVASALIAGWTLAVMFGLKNRDANRALEQLSGDLHTVAAASESAVARIERVESAATERDAEIEAEREAIASREAAVKSREAAVKSKEAEVRKRERAVTKQEKDEERNTISEGTWAVGSDVRPGTYRAKKPVAASCYWEITSDANGNDIVANDIPGGGRPTVTLSEGQYFSTNGCGEWGRR